MTISVYTIVVTYNGMPWLEKCLASLAASSVSTNLIIVDNGSTDGTPARIRELYPAILLLEPGENLGFGKANNLGIRVALDAGADFVFLLNQDAWAEPACIAGLLKLFNIYPKLGIASPMHRDGDDQDYDAYFHRYLLESDIPAGLINQGNWNGAEPEIIFTRFVNAAAWLLSADCLKKTGGFDPVFFHYGEDRNFCQRAIFNGFSIGISTRVRICHDRADRLLKKPDRETELKKTLNNYLVEFCDVTRPVYRARMFKRSVRHLFYGITNKLKGRSTDADYHFRLSRSILLSTRSVTNSRKNAGTRKDFLYLHYN